MAAILSRPYCVNVCNIIDITDPTHILQEQPVKFQSIIWNTKPRIEGLARLAVKMGFRFRDPSAKSPVSVPINVVVNSPTEISETFT